MAITDPRDIPDLVVWYSADYEATQYANGDIITTLHDLSGNGHNLSRSPISAQPHLRTTGGPGNGNYIDTLNPPGFTLPGGFALPNAVVSGLTAAERLIVTRNRAGEERGLEVMGTGSTSLMTFTDNQVYDSFASSVRKTVGSVATTPGNDTWFRYRSMSKAGGWTAWFNGTLKFTTGTNTVAWAASPTIAVTSNRNLHGFSLYVLYGRELTSGERTDLEAWAAANLNGGVATTFVDILSATEAETATALTSVIGGVSVSLGSAVETETAGALVVDAGPVEIPLGPAAEAEVSVAMVPTFDQAGILGTAVETETALGLVPPFRPFLTPEDEEHSRDFFFGRFGVKVGVTLIKVDGHYVRRPYPWLGELAGLEDGRDYFLGGHQYYLDADVAADLEADGYNVTGSVRP